MCTRGIILMCIFKNVLKRDGTLSGHDPVVGSYSRGYLKHGEFLGYPRDFYIHEERAVKITV
jgi:hypothetical protein